MSSAFFIHYAVVHNNKKYIASPSDIPHSQIINGKYGTSILYAPTRGSIPALQRKQKHHASKMESVSSFIKSARASKANLADSASRLAESLSTRQALSSRDIYANIYATLRSTFTIVSLAPGMRSGSSSCCREPLFEIEPRCRSDCRSSN